MSYSKLSRVPGMLGRDTDDVAPTYSSMYGTEAPTLHDALTSSSVKTAAAIGMTYHGYKRTGSLVWALIYGVAGRFVPTVAVPVAIAQGWGARKPCP